MAKRFLRERAVVLVVLLAVARLGLPGDIVQAANTTEKANATLTLSLAIVTPDYLASDPVKINLLIDGVARARNVQDTKAGYTAIDGSTGSVSVPAGTRSIGISAGGASSLTDPSGSEYIYGASVACTNGVASELTPAAPQTLAGVLSVGVGERVTCTITAERLIPPSAGTVVVSAQTPSTGEGVFDYTLSATVPGTILPGTNEQFSLNPSGETGFGITTVYGYPARVVLTQSKPTAPWTFVEASCYVENGTQSTIQVSAAKVTITLYMNESVVCTFVNQIP